MSPATASKFAAAKAASAARRAAAPAPERIPAIRVWIITGTAPVIPAFAGERYGVFYAPTGGAL